MTGSRRTRGDGVRIVAEVDVEVVMAYQWRCPDCRFLGQLEISEDFARESGQDHLCGAASSS